ncbi:MAG: TetR family transcriptional regulator, partial [Methylophilaceae bacterium]|nr:TetR family transcriptional regulator [Methylophilaceae bacterium]
YEQASAKGELREGLDPQQLAQDTNLFFSGLLHMWVKDLNGNRFRQNATQLIKFHIHLRKK